MICWARHSESEQPINRTNTSFTGHARLRSTEACSLFILDKGKPVVRPGRKAMGPGDSAAVRVVAERVLAVCRAKSSPASRSLTFERSEEGRNINTWAGKAARQASTLFGECRGGTSPRGFFIRCVDLLNVPVTSARRPKRRFP